MTKKKLLSNVLLSSFAAVTAIGIAACGKSGGTTTGDTPTTISTTTGEVTTSTDVAEENYIYVSNTGTSDARGTKSDPTSFEHAYDIAEPGDCILLAGGTYKYDYRLNIGLHGTNDVYGGSAGHYITVRPETEGERVIFDFSAMKFDGTLRGFQVYGDFWKFYGIEIYGAGDNGMYVAGSHNIVENCMFYGNRDSGLQLGRAFSASTTIDKWPSYNLIKNCTSFANYDDETYGENADGFAAKLTLGYGNVFDGCMAFRNSDDGWDLYAKTDSGNIGQVIIYNCVSFENGYLPYQIEVENLDGTKTKTHNTMNGDGIGFKLGGSVMEGDVIVTNSMTFDNKLHGIGDNSNPGYLSVNNVTAVNNCAGVNDDGTISDTRGIPGTQNNQNNIDLARSITSYNNYYGILSYINNQKNYDTSNDSAYNEDKFRGSTAYSIFQTGYKSSEVYTAFTEAEDASVYHSEVQDITYSAGTEIDPLTDDIFASMPHFNALCDSFEDLGSLVSFAKQFRNEDNSVNMGDAYRIVDENLLTYCPGNTSIGATLNKTSYEDYTHFALYTFTDEYSERYSSNEIEALAAYSVTLPVTNLDYTFQSFELPKLIKGCDISWESSNTDVISINSEEDISVSNTVYSMADVTIPATDTKVTLTATITYQNVTVKKTFEVNVKGRTQYLGELKSTNSKSIRVNVYGDYVEPRVYALDLASTYGTELPLSQYSTVTTYSYATDGNSKFYPVDGVYTSVPGVYEVTVVATYAYDASVTSTFTYRVYVVDPDCQIDFTDNESTVALTSDGFAVSGSLSQIDGYVVAITSDTPLTDITADDILANEKAQYVEITEDSIVAEFEADNLNVKDSDVQYYAYYIVTNKNESYKSQVYSFTATVTKINTADEFLSLARNGKLDSDDSSKINTTIYSLTTDLDFANYNGSFNSTVTNYLKTNDTEAASGKQYYTLEYKAVEDTTTMNFETNTYYEYDAENKAYNSTSDTEAASGKQYYERVGYVAVSDASAMDFANVTYYELVKNTFDIGSKDSVKSFSGLFNGNNHTISNITLVASSADKNVNVFYKIANGTLMNTNFTEIRLINQDSANGKNVAIVGTMCGGYIYDVHMTNISAKGREGIAALVGQVSGGLNYIERCSLVNPEWDPSDAVNNPYVISASNKYAGGIVGNGQMDTTESTFELTISNCYVSANIGDGKDAAGNTGGILGRVKNDSTVYYVELTNNYYVGTVIANGQYNAGIVGDFDNGLGYVKIYNNLSDVQFVYGGILWNAWEIAKDSENTQYYAHKNSNPIVGRAVHADDGIYDTLSNIGTFQEYYSTYIASASMVWNLSDYDEDGQYVEFSLTRNYVVNYLHMDIENIWNYDEATKTLTLRDIA